jgi:ABC-type lipoprotein export system ATPase subunit
VIYLNKVSKTYQDDNGRGRPPLYEVDLRVDAGEMVALLGDSGSGVSTLLAVLGLLDRPDSGSYRFDDTEVTGLSPSRLRRLRGANMGFVMPAFGLRADDTVAANVELPLLHVVRPRKRHRRAAQVLERVGLAGHHADMPVELFPVQLGRAIIARALINEPRVLLYDGPTVGLDAPSAAEIMELLTDLNRTGTTILFGTAEERIAGYAGRIVRLFEGRISDEQPITDEQADA